MFNLLPENLKKSIMAEYKTRRLTVILFFVLCLEFSFLIFLLPTWLSSMYREKQIVLQSEQVNNFIKNSNINPETTVIKSLNQKLGILNTELQYPRLLPLVDTILSQRTSQISITQINYTATASSSATIVLGGISATRESLVAFQKKLQDSGVFNKVDLPISNLAKDNNINFTINLSIRP